MAGEYLIFDAASSSIDGTSPGSPLNIGPGTDFRLREWDAPAPSQTVQWAGSVDTEGGIAASRKHENRVITLKIMCDTAAALRSLQGKVGKVAREGGTLRWILPNAETVTFDLLATDGFGPIFRPTLYRDAGRYCDVDIVLIAAPYGRGTEVDMGDNVETTLPVLIFTDTGVKGDMPGLGRLVIDEDASQDQITVLWGVRSRYYNVAAPLFFQAESGTPVSAVVATGPAGASGGASNNTIFNSTVPLSPTYDADFSVGGGHIGSYRIIARVWVPNTNAGTVSIRATWTAGQTPTAINNDPVALDPSYEANWLLVDLGQATSKAVPVGTASLALEFDSTSTAANDDVYWDWIALVPVDEGWGQVEASTAGQGSPLPSGGHLQIAHDHVLRTTGSRPFKHLGDYLLIPPAGAEGRTVQIIVKASRGFLLPHDAPFGGVPDAGTDDISARLFVTPRYLVVPEP